VPSQAFALRSKAPVVTASDAYSATGSAAPIASEEKPEQKAESKEEKKKKPVVSKVLFSGWQLLPQALQAHTLTFLSKDALAWVGTTSRASAALVRLPRADYFSSDHITWRFQERVRSIDAFKLFWNLLANRLPERGELKEGKTGVGLILQNVRAEIAQKIPLSVLPHIASLHIEMFEQSDFTVFKVWVNLLPNLRRLDLPGNQIGAIGVSMLIDALAPSARAGLTHLSICNTRLAAADLPHLSARLSSLLELRSLDLSANSALGAAGVAWLVGSLPDAVKASITTLKLRHTGLTAANAAILVPVLASLPGLRTLDLSDNPHLGSAGLVVLLNGVAATAKASINVLDIGNTGLTAANASELATVLRLFPGLNTFDLHGNSLLGASGVATSLNGLADEAKSGMLALNLSATGLTATDSALVRALGFFPKLHSLVLSYNRLGSASVAAMLNALSSSARSLLTTLILDRTALTSDGAEELACALGQLSGLQSVDLSFNSDMSAEGRAFLLRALFGVREQITRLYLTYSGQDDLDKASVLAQFPNLRDFSV
jgi:hypothetical protein